MCVVVFKIYTAGGRNIQVTLNGNDYGNQQYNPKVPFVIKDKI